MPSPQRRSRPAPGAAVGDAGDRALATAAGVVGDRWSLLVVARLLAGPRRFGELLDDIDGLAPNILARRLARLEAEGLVVGEPYSTRPVRHAYRLTASGHDLAGVLRMLAGWGARRHGAAGGAAHAACGTALEARWFCPTCDTVVDAPPPAGEGPPGDPDVIWV
jgi:DNA-binding HxlR family transcriptional regulator